MTWQENAPADVPDGEDDRPPARHRWPIFVLAVLACVLVAAAAGAAVAFGHSPDAPAPALRSSASQPARTPDPYAVAGDICTDSQAVMEHAVDVAQEVLPDAESRANFLGTEARHIDARCPALRPTFDAATMAAAGERIGP